MTKPSAQDWFGTVLYLQFAIKELADEIAVDTCQNNPRTVCMALRGLEAKADEIVGQMRLSMAGEIQ